MRTFYVVKNLTYKYNMLVYYMHVYNKINSIVLRGRIQGLKLEGTQVLGRGSGGRVEAPSRSRQSLGGGPGGGKTPENTWVPEILKGKNDVFKLRLLWYFFSWL